MMKINPGKFKSTIFSFMRNKKSNLRVKAKKPPKFLSKKNENYSTNINLLRITIIVIIVPILYKFLYSCEWSGFGLDSNKSESIERTIKDDKIVSIKKTNTENFQSYKTLWDWFGLAGTVAIPVVLFQFGRMEQQRANSRIQIDKERAERQDQTEREIAASNLRENAVETYIDRMSELLIDKKLLSIYNSKNKKDDGTQDVARIRTVTVLRRMDGDIERRSRILHFLRDAGLLGFLLEGAKLNGIDLSNADLSNTNFSSADLNGANLSGTNLNGANLSKSNISRANLTNTKLIKANLDYANLSNIKLQSSDLTEASLINCDLFQANILSTNLEKSNLTGSIFINATIKSSKFDEACLDNADLSLCELSGVSFKKASLKHVTSKEAIALTDHDGSVNLKCGHSSMVMGNLVRGKTKFTDVSLEGAIVDLADFSGSTFDETVDFRGMTYSNYDNAPIFPEGFDIKDLYVITDANNNSTESIPAK